MISKSLSVLIKTINPYPYLRRSTSLFLLFISPPFFGCDLLSLCVELARHAECTRARHCVAAVSLCIFVVQCMHVRFIICVIIIFQTLRLPIGIMKSVFKSRRANQKNCDTHTAKRVIFHQTAR